METKNVGMQKMLGRRQKCWRQMFGWRQNVDDENVGQMFVRRQNCWDGDKKFWHERNVGMRQNVGEKMLGGDKKCWDKTKILE